MVLSGLGMRPESAMQGFHKAPNYQRLMRQEKVSVGKEIGALGPSIDSVANLL